MRKVTAFLMAVAVAGAFGIWGCGATGGGGKPHASRMIDFSRLPKTPEMEAAFQKVEKLYFARKLGEAETGYQDYLKAFPTNFYTPKTYFRLGEISFANKNYKEAIAYYRKSQERGLDPDWGAYSIYKQAASYSNLEDYKRVIASLDRIPPDSGDKKVGIRAGSLRVTTANKLSDLLEAKKGYLEVIDASQGLRPGDARVGDLNWLVNEKSARDEIKAWIAQEDSDVGSIPEIRSWYPRFEGKPSGGYICWKLARLYNQKGDYKSAIEWSQRYVLAYPKDEYFSQAHSLVAEIEKRTGKSAPQVAMGGRASVGVLLPLTGKYAVYGESVLHGIECAGGVFEPCRGDLGVNLLIRDTKGDPQTATKLVAELASNSDVRAVIGPLPQVEVDQAAAAAEAASLPMISLSQKQDVPKLGQFIFRNFLTVQDQVASVVNYACSEKKWKKLAIIYPAGETGEEYKKSFEQEVDHCGGKIVAQASYAPETKSFTDIIRNLISSGKDQGTEVKANFDALFVPDVYRKIPSVALALQAVGIQGVHLLGGAGWDHPSLLNGGAQALEGSVYVNGFYAKSSNFTTRDFVSTFNAAYGVEPTILEAYAFDTLRLLGEVLRETPSSDRSEIQKALAKKKNFAGVTGAISFDDDGDARRRLTVLTIEQGEVREIR